MCGGGGGDEGLDPGGGVPWKPLVPQASWVDKNVGKFLCAKLHSPKAQSFEQCLAAEQAAEHNLALAEVFKEIEGYQGNRKGAPKGVDASMFKAKAYREAREKVQQFPRPITRHNLLEVVKAGSSCYNKAMEFLTKGSVCCLDEWRKVS